MPTQASVKVRDKCVTRRVRPKPDTQPPLWILSPFHLTSKAVKNICSLQVFLCGINGGVYAVLLVQVSDSEENIDLDFATGSGYTVFSELMYCDLISLGAVHRCRDNIVLAYCDSDNFHFATRNGILLLQSRTKMTKE